MRVLLLVLLVGALLAAPAEAQSACGQTLQSLIDAAAAGATVLVPACTYHEYLQINKPITLDGQHQAIWDGDGVREYWVFVNASNVTLKNWTFRNTSTAQDHSALGTQPGIVGLVITGNTFSTSANGILVGVGGTVGARVANNDVSGGGQIGINAVQNSNLVIQGNHVHGNNTAHVDPGYAAGGIHAVAESGLQVLGNEVDHNAGPGIWCDIGCSGVSIAGNSVHDQAFNPIFYEISSNAQISGNTVTSSPLGPMNWGCITSSTSGDVSLHDNVCSGTGAMLALYDNRSDVPADAGHNVQMLNNRFANLVPDPNQVNPTELTRWWQYTAIGPLVVGQNGNVDSGNALLVAPTPTPTPLPKSTATVTCQVEVFLNGVSQGRKAC